MNEPAKASRPTVAEVYLALLRDRGVRNLYLNAGTDFAPLVEAYAEAGADCERFPTPVLAAHENVVAGMAHGAYLMTGDPQAIMVHVSVGTANVACAVINAARDNVPLIVTAGRSPILEAGPAAARDTAIQWAQEMYDQAGLLREMVKWEYELRDGRQLADVVDRALGVATSHPLGPVYLTLPREVLAETVESDALLPAAGPPPSDPAPDHSAVELLADRLASARFPVIVTIASGADPRSVEQLAQFCERFAIGVVEPQPRYVNVPADHPFHLGYRADDALAEADVACFLECAVPWIPRWNSPHADTFIAQIGSDPLFAGYPMRSHRSDLTITSASRTFLAAVSEAMSRRGPIDAGRRALLAERAAMSRGRAARAVAQERDDDGPITPAFLSGVLGEAMAADDDMVLFNEYWASVERIRPRLPRSYFLLAAAGGLGWALPAALGAKHAAPERTVVAAVGDGSYFFANPAACHHAAQKHGLAVLTVVSNNARWGAVDWSTANMYPGGHAVRTAEARLSSLAPMPAFEDYVAASGGYGERVTRRGDVRDALERALHVVRVERRQALLNVICA
jgi:acetolactate synthase-1/2/3 large subunit